MKFIKFLILGAIFGIVMVKSEAISWYRIQEMFRFQSFHMFGIIGTSVILGIIGVSLIKKYKLKDTIGEPIVIPVKAKFYKSAILGGTIFGLGWALSGACPGPMVVSIGDGYISFIIVVLFGLLGTYLYGYIREKLPH